MGYRGRFAPSPTGPIHLGTARTALLGWLRARGEGGAFVLRMEDLDAPRARPGAAQAILEDLAWLGLDWDEGPDVGGPCGPYTQSEKLDRYAEVLARLAPFTYPCTCSRKEIQELASAPHGAEPVYPGTCRAGPTHPEREAATRFRMPDPPPAFDDAVLGRVEGVGRGDFVLHRRDGAFAYQLACVVDDHDMRITEVLRGADLVASTPRQIALYEALGWPVLAFAHVPLVLGPDGERLAKRHGAISIAELRAAGQDAASIVGALAHGVGLIDAPRPTRPAELVGRLELARLRAR
ncbi:MAG: tRNA glutamyl-Q(34) synthetase GluQRS [Sandaracinaceae bacterium]|nr:tRNA glutamyl-Q(34) synthetase GluQRS [Sandaracinaceae bacterium]